MGNRDVDDDTLAEMLEDVDDEDLVEFLLMRNHGLDEAAVEKDVTERIAHAGDVRAAYEHATAQADEAMSLILAKIEAFAAEYDPLYSAIDELERRLEAEPEPLPEPEPPEKQPN